ncbi:hypothetical protein [Nautilia sp.]
MNKFFILFFPFFLFAEFIKFPYTLKLKKDETALFQVYYKDGTYPLKLRWTLFTNGVLTLLYRYDNYPRQITLFREYPLNTFKIDIVDFSGSHPYFYIKFKEYNGKIALFDIYLFNGEKVKVDLKGEE